MSELSICDAVSCFMSCKSLNQLSANEQLWRTICQREFGVIIAPLLAASDEDLTKRETPYWFSAVEGMQIGNILGTIKFLPEQGWTHSPWKWIAACLQRGIIPEDEEDKKGKKDEKDEKCSSYKSYASFGQVAEQSQSPDGRRIGYTLEEDEVYLGDARGGECNGRGMRLVVNPLEFYVGEFAQGESHGVGTFIYNTGRVYAGGWNSGRRSGMGLILCGKGESYSGEWKENHEHGSGERIYGSGARYKGEWNMGKKEGRGEFTWNDGSCYVGEWRGGKMCGHGVITYIPAECYDGEWKDDMQDGRGEYVTSFGSVYIGEQVKEVRNGEGTFTHPDGTSWSGNWKDGLPDDIDSALHPRMKEVIDSGKCTLTLTGNEPFYGQVVSKCLVCFPVDAKANAIDEDDTHQFVCDICIKKCHTNCRSGGPAEELPTKKDWTLGRIVCSCKCSKL
eukprot:TRINITY_DN4480_c0_g1_i1.p1 TRINITY_DN4480_c0_g1~~TRINITY_DN4480_c0_g1_i1.p1  ORF type:complete len:477 (+),score=45.27 TRINITY_DN4480_c0_g1_i1:87-1433(+)